MFQGITELLAEQNKLEQYGFTASKDRYMSASALEEITDYLSDLAKAETFAGAMKELDKLIEIVKWHKDNLEETNA